MQICKSIVVDKKLVGIAYLGAFLITNDSCVMMPGMSVVQSDGCNPSCGPMLKQQCIFKCILSVQIWCFSHTTHLFGPVVVSSVRGL